MHTRLNPPLLDFFLRSVGAFALASATAFPITAQPVASHPLDLETCVKIAVERSPFIRAAQEGTAAATEAVGISRAPFYPEVGFDARYRRFDTHVFLPQGMNAPATTVGSTDDWMTDLKASYVLFDSGLRRAELDATALGRAATEEDALRVIQDVVLGVRQAYYDLLAARAARVAADARIARRRDHLRIASVRKAAGAAPQADVLRAHVEVADAELALVRADSNVRIAKGDLNVAMGLPVDRPVEIAEDTASRRTEPPEVTVALARAREQRPEVKALRQRVAAANRGVAAAKASFGPRVKAEGAFGWRDDRFVPADKDWSAGLTVQIPVFTGFASKHRSRKAANEAAVKEAELGQLYARIDQEVWTAHARLLEARQAVAQTEVLKDEATETLRFVRARYEAGASSITDLLDAEAALTQAESGHVQAVLGVQLAGVRLKRMEGEL
jgi:outer membrane protein